MNFGIFWRKHQSQKIYSFFDKLIFSSASIAPAELVCSNLPLRPCDKDLVKRKLKEIEKYMKAGLINDYSANDFKKDCAIFHSNDETKEIGQYLIESDFENPCLDKNNPKDYISGSLSSLTEIVELKSRIFSIINNSHSSDDYIPIIRQKYKKTLITEKLDISDDISVVLKKFPIINENISVKNIIEFTR